MRGVHGTKVGNVQNFSFKNPLWSSSWWIMKREEFGKMLALEVGARNQLIKTETPSHCLNVSKDFTLLAGPPSHYVEQGITTDCRSSSLCSSLLWDFTTWSLVLEGVIPSLTWKETTLLVLILKPYSSESREQVLSRKQKTMVPIMLLALHIFNSRF